MSNSRIKYKNGLTYCSSSVSNMEFHIVWCTKYRYQGLNETERSWLTEEIIKIAKDNDCIVKNIKVMPNHVHMLISVPPKIAISAIVKKIKGTTGRRLFTKFPDMKDKFWHHHVWSPSYFVNTVGAVNEDVVAHYIDTQWERPFK